MLPCNPIPWPLERVPLITEADLGLVLHSIALERLTAKDPFAGSSLTPEAFLHTSWSASGFDDEAVAGVADRFGRMFGLNLPEELVRDGSARPGQMTAWAFAAWQTSERKVTFFTSGSTGSPKPCTHREDHLRQELVGIAPLMAGCLAARVPVPLHHMYGFTFGLQLPRTLGIPIIKTVPLPQVITSQMQPGDLLVGIPHLWKRVVEGAPVNGQGVTLLTATSPTPPEVLHALIRWGFRCREMFGASETGAMCWRESPDAPFTLLPHFVRDARTPDEAGRVRRRMPDGTVQSYPLLDTIRWLDEEHLFPAGRKDSAVQVAGRNVYPEHVANTLRGHDGVSECSVRLMRPDEGDRLKAFVVPRAPWQAADLLPQLKALCKERLAREECPTTYTFGDDLPRTGLGKPTDW